MSPADSLTNQQHFTSVNWDETSDASTPTDSSRSHNAEKLRKRKELKGARRRIVRACQRCRLRKTRCDGGKPCTRCIEADDVCEYIKCTKKESKEYSQDYVDRLIEQNDQYKKAMRVLYANRRLSIHPDNIVIPATDSDDVPLVHDILERLGLLGEDSDDLPVPSRMARSDSEPASPQSMSTPSMSEQHWGHESPTTSLFDTTSLDAASSFNDDLVAHNDVFAQPEMDSTFYDTLAMEAADLDLELPFEMFTTMQEAPKPSENLYQLSQDFALFPDMIPQTWDQLSGFQDVLNTNIPLENSWMMENQIM